MTPVSCLAPFLTQAQEGTTPETRKDFPEARRIGSAPAAEPARMGVDEPITSPLSIMPRW